jgi:hypothetical protein
LGQSPNNVNKAKPSVGIIIRQLSKNWRILMRRKSGEINSTTTITRHSARVALQHFPILWVSRLQGYKLYKFNDEKEHKNQLIYEAKNRPRKLSRTGQSN